MIQYILSAIISSANAGISDVPGTWTEYGKCGQPSSTHITFGSDGKVSIDGGSGGMDWWYDDYIMIGFKSLDSVILAIVVDYVSSETMKGTLVTAKTMEKSSVFWQKCD